MASKKTTVNTNKVNADNVPEINTNALIDINQTSYYIQEDWFEVMRKFFNINNDDTESISMLKAGLFGYNNEIISNEIKNNVYHRNIIYDEHFLNTASFPESIYNFAKTYNYDIDFATPSHCRINFAIAREDLINNKFREEVETETGSVINKRVTYKLIINNDYTFLLGEYQFRLPYPIIVNFKETADKTDFSITAYYDTNNSDFPYLTLSTDYIKMWSAYDSEQGKRMVYMGLDLFQLSYKEQEFNIISEDISDNLFYNVNFTDQIAYFEVFYVYNGETIKLNTYFNNTFQPDDDENFCYYAITDDDILQISFSAVSGSFRPAINSKLLVKVYTTKGSSGNFSYIGSKISVNFNNNGEFDKVPISIIPITECSGGKDDPTYTEVKNGIIDKFAVRDNLIIDNDLDVHFKAVNNSETVYGSSIQWIKKRNDVLKRLYTAYLTIRDKNKNIIPTNTAPKLYVSWNYLNNNSNKLCIKENTDIIYDYDRDIFVIDGDLVADNYEVNENLSKYLNKPGEYEYEVSYRGEDLEKFFNIKEFDESKTGLEGYTGIKYEEIKCEPIEESEGGIKNLNDLIYSKDEEKIKHFKFGYMYNNSIERISDKISNFLPSKNVYDKELSYNADLDANLPNFRYSNVYDDFIFNEEAIYYNEYVENEVLNEGINGNGSVNYKFYDVNGGSIKKDFTIESMFTKEIGWKDNKADTDEPIDVLVPSDVIIFNRKENGFKIDYKDCKNVKRIEIFLNSERIYNISGVFDASSGSLKTTVERKKAYAFIPENFFLSAIYNVITVNIYDRNNNAHKYLYYVTDFNRNNYINIITEFDNHGYHIRTGSEGDSIEIIYKNKKYFSNNINSACDITIPYSEIKSKSNNNKFENTLIINAYNKKSGNNLTIPKYFNKISNYSSLYENPNYLHAYFSGVPEGTPTVAIPYTPPVMLRTKSDRFSVVWNKDIKLGTLSESVITHLVTSTYSLYLIDNSGKYVKNIPMSNITTSGFDILFSSIDSSLKIGTNKLFFSAYVEGYKVMGTDIIKPGFNVNIALSITKNLESEDSDDVKMNFCKEIMFVNPEYYYDSGFKYHNNEIGYYINSGKSGKNIKVLLNDNIVANNSKDSSLNYIINWDDIVNSQKLINKISIGITDYYNNYIEETFYVTDVNQYFRRSFNENGFLFEFGPTVRENLVLKFNNEILTIPDNENNLLLDYNSIKNSDNYTNVISMSINYYGQYIDEKVYIRNKINNDGKVLTDRRLKYKFPFLLAVQHNPILVGNYFNTFIDKEIAMKFQYINPHVDDNFSLQYLKVTKNNIGSTKYTFNVALNSTFNIIDESNIIVRLIICDENSNPYGYINLKPLDTLKSSGMGNKISSFQFEGYMDVNQNQPIINNQLRVTRLYDCKTKGGKEKVIPNVNINSKINLQLGILIRNDETDYKFGNFSEMSDLNNGNSNINENGFTTAVIYETETVNEIFQNMYNYMESDILTPLELKEEIGETEYKSKFGSSQDIFAIKQVPLIETEYFENSPNSFFDIWNVYVNIVRDSINYFENLTSVDIKLINSYGNSKYYYHSFEYDENNEIKYNFIENVQLDIDLSLHLNYYINDETDSAIKKYISDYLESCNDGKIFPISNLITKLENNFDIIKYIEFFDIAGNSTQKIKSKFTSLLDLTKEELDSYVPEYVNVKKKLDLSQKGFIYETDSDGNYVYDSNGEKILIPDDDLNETLTYPYNYNINVNYTYN